MEALAAIGLAGNVVQFVHFTSELISAGNEISDSVQGSTRKNAELEKVYSKLHAFSSNLQKPASDSPSTAPIGSDTYLRRLASSLSNVSRESDVELQSHIQSLEDLAGECKTVCGQLLDIVRNLRAEGPSRRPFKSFMAALKTTWSSRMIQGLEESLGRFRGLISLHFFPLLSYQQSATLQTLNRLREESAALRVDQSTKLDGLAFRLEELHQELQCRRISSMACSSSLTTSTTTWSTYQSTIVASQTEPLTGERESTLSTVPTLTEHDMVQLERGISTLLLTQKDLNLAAKEHAFLRTLNFPSRTYRHDDIHMAHQDTFQWILDPAPTCLPLPPSSPLLSGDEAPRGCSLAHWLAHDDGLFWISGKAGCGKSTLMKMLARHPTTGNLVQKWAGCKKSVIAAHYFWTAGSAMQKSRQGFVQALLYDIFRSCPDLIPEMMPARWAKLDRSAEETADTDDEWTLPQLLHALQQLSCSPSLPARYCVIVDGIDEFDGDHFEMCEFLKTLSKSPNFKLCVSSRPWNVFEDAFGGNDALCRRLCIHELTQHDILAFAQSRMAEYPRWKEPDFSAEQMESIIKDITDRAHGVFLWVSLVTRSLREGLVNGDTVLDLRKRLESLPADLEAFFRHMMNTVDPLYHERMARVLRIAVNAKESLSLQFYYMREFEEEDTDYALNKPIEWFFVDQIEDSLEQCRRRINARCGGLLEVKDHRVEFLHRTVRDFLMTRDMSEYLREKSGSDFLVNLSTLKAFVFLFRFWFHSNMDMRLTSELPRWNWEQAIGYANGAIVESKEASFMLLDAVDDHYNGSFAPNDPAALGVETHHVFLSSLLLAGVDVYICAKLDDDDIWLFGNLQGSPICKIIDLARWDARHVRIITSLLESDLDCDINQEYDEYKGYDDEGSDGEEGSETESEEEEEQEIGTQKQRATVKNQIGESKVNVDSESVESEDSENRAGAETKGHDRDDDDVGPLSPWHRLLRRAYHEPEGNLFRAAVENSLFSTFLKHGARKDVRLKAPCWLPCTNVIMAMIRHVESHRFRSECIALLDDFLQGNSSDVKDQLEEVLKVIADELCEPTRQQRDQRRLQFIAEILHRLIRSGIKNGVEMDCLVSRIRTSFPGATGSILEDLIRHKEESRYFNTSKPGRHRKRKARGQNIGPEKRVRPK